MPKGGITNGVKWYACDNYRPESKGSGRVVADLYDENGEFHRSAVVADCGDELSAKRYAKEQNARQREENESCTDTKLD